MAQHIVYLKECSMDAWKEYMFYLLFDSIGIPPSSPGTTLSLLPAPPILVHVPYYLYVEHHWHLFLIPLLIIFISHKLLIFMSHVLFDIFCSFKQNLILSLVFNVGTVILAYTNGRLTLKYYYCKVKYGGVFLLLFKKSLIKYNSQDKFRLNRNYMPGMLLCIK